MGFHTFSYSNYEILCKSLLSELRSMSGTHLQSSGGSGSLQKYSERLRDAEAALPTEHHREAVLWNWVGTVRKLI